jgi:murein DD-endopeptidase MepM/ murein hydrolase activator NlpD
LLNASVGMQRVRERLRPTSMSRATTVAGLERRTRHAVERLTDRIGSIARAADGIRAHLPGHAPARGRPRWDPRVRSVRIGSRAPGARLRMASATRRRSGRLVLGLIRPPTGVGARLRSGVRSEGVLPIAVAAIVLFASVASGGPGALTAAPIGGPTGDAAGPRIVVGGGFGTDLPAFDPAAGGNPADTLTGGTFEGEPSADDVRRALEGLGPEARALQEEPVEEGGATPIIDGPFLADGTLLKPVAVDTSVADGAGLVHRYRVRSGDTLVRIASRFDISMMTIWWANRLSSKDDLKVGQMLRIPTVDGLVVTVREGDTLEAIATRNHVKADTIYEVNGLNDRSLVIGQTLLIPGAQGREIRVPRPTAGSGGSSRPRSSNPVRPPPSYGGGAFSWPVSGGYISQYFHYGHYGIDVAADYGSRVRSAASGTVIFAGWKSNGGGYQVWIAHGSGLYTTYNHMSGVSVGRGQSVGRGDQVGRVGCTGWCTGPHLHFEVWRGPVWDGGHRVNPLIYY